MTKKYLEFIANAFIIPGKHQPAQRRLALVFDFQELWRAVRELHGGESAALPGGELTQPEKQLRKALPGIRFYPLANQVDPREEEDRNAL